MGALSERKMAIVRTLVETAPDRVVGGLHSALVETAYDSALGGVRQLVDCEVAERTLRNSILQPVAPMFVGQGDDVHALTFPGRALGLLWRGLRAGHGSLIDHAAQLGRADGTPLELLMEAYDAVIAAAGADVRAGTGPHFGAVAAACDASRQNGAELLAGCLDIAPIVRRATQRLPEWIMHPGGETAAAARLAYKDTVALADDAGPRFFDMLAAQMGHPWMVLRVICAVMDKPTERYLADSEMARFGAAVMDEIDASIAAIGGLKGESAAEDGRSAAKRVALVVQQILEVETNVDLTRDHGWGKRVHQQRASLAAVVEGRLKDAEKAVLEALPMHTPKHLRTHRQIARLTSPPELRHLERARTLLAFSDELRTTANYGGFSSARGRLVEKLSEYLSQYVEEVLELIRHAEVEDTAVAAAFLNVAADFSELVSGEKAGELVRRRTHAALTPGSALETHS